MQHIRYTYHQLDTLSILEHCGQTKPLRKYGGAFQAGRDCFGISSCSTYALMPEGPEGPEGAEGDDLTWRLSHLRATYQGPIGSNLCWSFISRQRLLHKDSQEIVFLHHSYYVFQSCYGMRSAQSRIGFPIQWLILCNIPIIKHQQKQEACDKHPEPAI